MSIPYGVAVHTRIAGAAQGDITDDIIDNGQWPKHNPINRISKIAVYKGDVIDALRITYETDDGPKTVIHGGDGGTLWKQPYVLKENQTITAVYGRRLNSDTKYGSRCIVQLSFVIVTPKTDASTKPDTDVYSADGDYVKDSNRSNTQFQFTWPLVGAISYSLQPSGQPNKYLQGLGFTELFPQAGGPL